MLADEGKGSSGPTDTVLLLGAGVSCEYDGGAGFNTKFKAEHVSTADYFHPSVAGQALIASVAWNTLGY